MLQVRQRKPGLKQVFVEERRYDTLDDNSDADAPKIPATLPSNPSAETLLDLDALAAADVAVLESMGDEPTFTSTGDAVGAGADGNPADVLPTMRHGC